MRETSFQQVLLSSSGPKENVFISNFDISLGVSENVIPNNIYNNLYKILQIGKLLLIILLGITFSDTPKDISKLLMKTFSLGPDEDRRTC